MAQRQQAVTSNSCPTLCAALNILPVCMRNAFPLLLTASRRAEFSARPPSCTMQIHVYCNGTNEENLSEAMVDFLIMKTLQLLCVRFTIRVELAN